MKRSWRLLGLVLVAVVCLAVAALLRPAVGHEAEMAGSIDDTQATSTAQEPDTGEDGPQILVLNYHKVSDEFLSLAVAPADFDWQMRTSRSTAITRSRPTSSTTRSRARASCPIIPS